MADQSAPYATATLLLTIMGLLAIGSAAMNLAFEAHAATPRVHQPSAISGYFILVAAGLLACVWYGQSRVSRTGLTIGLFLAVAVALGLLIFTPLLILAGAAGVLAALLLVVLVRTRGR